MVSCIETCDFQCGHQQSQRSTHHFWILVFIYELLIWEGAHTWNYNYSATNMTWPDAREYCQKSFTDLLAIQNQEEINYLNQVLPRNPTYYWIGIRKIGGVWTWVGTNKSLDKEAENWAHGEPTPGGEDCVEIYIKREREAGKWNNHSCNKNKVAICYLASCKPNSCNNRGECMETVGGYKCRCDEGFYGPECEFVKQCAILRAPVQVKMLCSHPIGNFSFNSMCDFHCAAGFTLQGSQSLQCTAAGRWTAEAPSCEAVKCGNLEIPEKGFMNCSHPFRNFSYKSACTFSCDKGFELRGSDRIQCGTSGQWNGQKPTCEVKQCAILRAPVQAKMLCSHPIGNFSFNSMCDFHCAAGFTLQGSQSLQCTAAGRWTAEAPSCEAVKCGNLEIPEKGFMNCSHPFRDFSYKSACTFSCDKGFELRGSDRIQCGTSGQWNGQKPTCEAIQCENLEFLGRGIKNCTHSTGQFNYSSTCRFCGSARSELHGSGTQETGALGNWTTQSPTTEVYPFDKMWEPHKSTAATVGTAFTLLLLSFIVWGIIRRYRKAKQEKTPLARNEDNLETTAV